MTRGEGRTLKDVIEILKSKIGDFQIEINQDKSFYPKRGTLDISNAKSKLGFNPKYNLEKGIDDYLSYLQQNDKY